MSDGFDQIPKFIRESWFVIMKVGVFLFWVLGLGAISLPQELHKCIVRGVDDASTLGSLKFWQDIFFMRSRLRKNSC